MRLKQGLSGLALAACFVAGTLPLASAADAPVAPDAETATAPDESVAPETPAASADEGIPAGADTAAEDSDTVVEGEEPKK